MQRIASVCLMLLVVLSMQSAGAQNTVQVGIFNAPVGSNLLSVRAKPAEATSGVFSGVNLTVRWLTSYNVTVSVTATAFGLAQQGPVGTSGAYTYATFGAIPNLTINWASGSETEIVRLRVDGNTGTGTFELANSSPGSTEWYFELGGVDLTHPSAPFYQTSASLVPLPVQIASFTALALSGSQVRLEWKTLSETDNLGFEVQRALEATGPFISLEGVFIEGHGTTIEPQEYSYTDAATGGRSYYYRLKQVDRSGTVHYTEAVQATAVSALEEEAPLPTVYSLEQNYPNPFNPTTTISYQLPASSHVRLKVFDMLGREVATLVQGAREAGYHKEQFNAAGLGSGIYFYRLEAGEQKFTKRMLLVR